jgi:hypothetical protein
MRRVLIVIAAFVACAACNPLTTDPVTVGGEFDETAATYTGPSPAWLQIAVSGAPDHRVYALALVLERDRVGPGQRLCGGPTGPVECIVTRSDVRTPNQRVVPGNGSRLVRLMTVWSGERVQVALVCVDPDTQELGCPEALRATLQTVDPGGTLIGDLTPAAAGP